ncbi:aldehyde ferredoxin oxidoreductase [Candidatus Bathyarchaeota archaeon]|nr:MAG: aldehyde ferredoxin oxidoreductase [Candidatus Hecatellales archaeon]RLI35134.1 MAG: aldehyde ferredoxin oxidoreductase [Candidatus Bathyarchaeota archaeon]
MPKPMESRIAYIDLSKGKATVRKVPEGWIRLFLGGRGVSALLLYGFLNPKVDPLSPENILVVSVGLVAGAPLPSSRFNVGAKSPLTGALGSSNCGGHFAPELRAAGFDHLIIKGKSEKPAYLWISDGEVEVRDASHLWGLDTFEAQEALREELGDPTVQSLVIGPAGENLVKFANLRTGMKSSAGRTGMGAVMGSKNLKAIAVKGNLSIEFAYPDKVLDLCLTFNENLKKTKFFTVMQVYGSMHIFSYTNTAGMVRVRNAQGNQLFPSDKLEAEAMKPYSVGYEGCYGCPIHCRHRYIVETSRYGLIYGEGPEYTSQGCWGSMMEINDTECMLICNHLVNRLGLDTLETGSMIAWAIELFERGLIDEKTTGGMRLKWGEPEIVYELIEKIAYREGFGAVLAEGPRGAIRKLGAETAYYNLNVKGMSWIQSEDRAIPSFVLGASVATRGADHLRSRPAIDLFGLPKEFLEKLYGGPVSSDFTSYEGKELMVWKHEVEYAVIDSLGLCKFACSHFITPHSIYSDTFNAYQELSQLVYYVTGLEISSEKLQACGERIYTLERMFNVREGFTRKDDYPPQRYFEEPLPDGLPIVRGKKMDREKYEKLLDAYYELHGWDREGIPKPETLRRLGLEEERIEALVGELF